MIDADEETNADVLRILEEEGCLILRFASIPDAERMLQNIICEAVLVGGESPARELCSGSAISAHTREASLCAAAGRAT